MTRKVFVSTVIGIAALLAACEKEAPVPMQMEVGAQVTVSGNRAAIVKADTTHLVIVRDSVADEKTDTVYNLHTSLTLTLDSTFLADKMEDSLQLRIGDVTLAPTDSVLATSLIAFLKQQPGAPISINFAGEAVRSQFLQLGAASEATLSGFSFHELDPESLADPKITAMLKEYLDNERYFREMEEEGMMYGSSAAYMLGQHEMNERSLEIMKDKMTPKQRKAYEAARNRKK